MKNTIHILSLGVLALLFSACSSDEKADAYGNFETDEITISAKTPGEILRFTVTEGQTLKKGQSVGYIDTTNLHLQRAELKASLLAAHAQKQNVEAQITVGRDELKKAKNDQKRIVAMYKKDAATKKQLDDINSMVTIAEKKLAVLKTQYPAIEAQVAAIEAKNQQLNQMLNDAVLTNPIDGIVLSKLAEAHEITAPGKPLYKIANLDYLELRAFVAGSQLTSIEIGQQYTVKIDGPDENMLSYQGELIWISTTAEFTPKTIQTKKDRVDLVYAVKLRVKNDGKIKIGMPGEVWINEAE